MGGILVNTGHSVEWRALTSLQFPNATLSSRPEMTPANVSGGPLSYTYTLTHARLHFGDKDSHGSEHTINKIKFPAEVSFGDNKNFSY